MNAEHNEWFVRQVCGHRRALQRYLRRFRLGPEDCEDLVQESLLRIYAVPDAGTIQSPRALLFSIAHNLAVERLRRSAAQATDTVADFEVLDVYSTGAGPEERADGAGRFRQFCVLVADLPPVCRRAFVLRKVYGLTPEEIATVLGSSVSTIEKHVAKGLLRCRDKMIELGMLDGLVRESPADLRGRKST